MGGICGVIDWGGKPVDQAVVNRMMDAERHRGPDYSEVKLVNAAGVSAAFGNGLLLFDGQDERPPAIFAEARSTWAFMDGEICDLDGLGRRFVPELKSPAMMDYELVAALYAARGEDLFRELNGAFSLAIWDRKEETLVLCRDRVGTKPLYYLLKDQEFVFASELKSLLCHPKVERRLSLKALSKYLAYEYVPTPDAIIEGVRKVPAASFLVVKNGSMRVEKYHRIRFSTLPKGSRSEAGLVEEMRTLLTEAVRRRLHGPAVPGIFLSGGIDSSAMVAFASRLTDARKIKTFSLGFTEKSFDESPHARTIAERFGTDHHVEMLDHTRTLDAMPEVFRFLDEPFADASIIPTSLVCRWARQHVRVVIGGDAGDEFFRGYPTFLAHQVAGYLGWMPKPLFGLMRSAASFIPVSMANISFDFKIKQFLKGLAHEPGVRNQIWLGSFDADDQTALLADDVSGELGSFDPYEDLANYAHEVDYPEPMDRIAHLYIRTYLPDDGFVKTDRAAAPVGLGLRSPMLDNDLLDFVNALPPDYKSKGAQTKIILKKALSGILPPSILERPKKGFGIPVAFWLRNELKELMLDTLSADRMQREGLFRPDAVTRLVDEHLSGNQDNRKYLWTLICFELWKQHYLP